MRVLTPGRVALRHIGSEATRDLGVYYTDDALVVGRAFRGGELRSIEPQDGVRMIIGNPFKNR